MKLLQSQTPLVGTMEVPGDKSISHRSIMFGAIASGETVVHNFLKADDCLGTLEIFKQLGVPIREENEIIYIEGVGFNGFKQPKGPLDVGNSGTTIRLLMGLLGNQPFDVTLTGDQSIQKRPMNRVILPLKNMGVAIEGSNNSEFPPISLKKVGPLQAITYQLPIASAQVKSALIFAALQAKGETTLIEKEGTRDHTEVMLRQFEGEIHTSNKTITLTGNQALKGQTVRVPGDISSAAFFFAAGLLVPDSCLTIKNVGLSPSRTGVIDVIRDMGGSIEITDIDEHNLSGTVTVKHSQLKGITISGGIIPRLIDEIPIIALLATQAEGVTVIKDAEELRVKETDRILAVATELRKLGASIEETDDGMIITGTTLLHGGNVQSYGDHRIGMMLQIAALLTEEFIELKGSEAVSVSYPLFFEDVATLMEMK